MLHSVAEFLTVSMIYQFSAEAQYHDNYIMHICSYRGLPAG